MKRSIGKSIVVLLIALSVFLTGCSQEQVLDTSLRSAISLVINAAVAENEDAARVVEHMQAKISFEILSTKTTKKGVDALYRVSSPDLTAFIEDFDVNNYATQEEMVEAIIHAIDSAPITEKEVTVGFQNGVPVEYEDFLYAYSGGSYSLIAGMQGGVNNNGNGNNNGNNGNHYGNGGNNGNDDNNGNHYGDENGNGNNGDNGNKPTNPIEPPANPVEPPADPVKMGKVVIKYLAEGKYVTGTPLKYPYKWALQLSKNKADALTYNVIENGDGTISFKTDCGRYLSCYDDDLMFITENDNSTKFNLIVSEDGYYIHCAYTNHNGWPQYLEVWDGVLSYYAMVEETEPSMFTFAFEAATGAAGVVVENYKVPIFETNMDKAVIKYVAEEKYVTRTEIMDIPAASMKLSVSENKADALVYNIVKNADGTITFKTDCKKFLYCDGKSVELVSQESNYTKFVLEVAKGGCYIRCATAVGDNGNAQYLEVFNGSLTAYNKVTKIGYFIFALENTAGAASVVQENAYTNIPFAS